jgi:hypothetical protein
LWLTDVPTRPRAAHSSTPLAPSMRVRADVSWASGTSLIAVDGSF